MALLLGILTLCAHTSDPSPATLTFDTTSQRLSLAGDAVIHSEASLSGFIKIIRNKTVFSSDPLSPYYAPALAGLSNQALREIHSTDAVELAGTFAPTHALKLSASSIAVSGHIHIPGGILELLSDSKNETRLTGTLDVSSSSRGGTIRCLGGKITLAPSARIDASGASGGGEILLGGDYLGGNNIPTATTTRVQHGAIVRADALAHGNGGRVIVWADDLTAFHGRISARGGPQHGDGGFVEVSGKASLDFTGVVDTGADHGSAGTLLLDPANITIQSMNPDLNGDTTTGDNITNATQLDEAPTDFPGMSSVITDGALEAVLATGNVTLAATNTITFNSVVNLNTIGTTPRTLTLNAGLNIIINGGGGFSATGATTSLNLVLNCDSDLNNTGRFFTEGNIETNGGSITIVSRDTVTAVGVYIDANITTNGGNITITGSNPTDDIRLFNGSNISVGAGNITLTGNRINIEAGTSLSGTGNLTLQPSVDSTAMLVGGAGSTSTDFLTAAEISEINDGFNSITIGRTDSSGAITVHATGVTFTDSLVLRSPNGAINVNGVLTTTGGAGVTLQNGGTATVAATGGVTSDGPVAQTGSGAVSLLGPISTTNDNITFAGAVTTSGTLVGLTAGTGTVTFNNALTINGVSAGSLPIGGNLVFGSVATLNLTVNGIAPSQFDRVFVTGSVTLGGTLTPTFGYTPMSTDANLFIDNDGSDAVSGAFANQGPGSLLTVGGTKLVFRHNSGTGNDVAFTVNQPPVFNSLSFLPTDPVTGQTVTFTVAASDPESQPTFLITYNYGDGVTDTTGTHAYANPGTYTVSVSVTDGIETLNNTASVTVTQAPPPPPDPGPGGGGSPDDLDGDGIPNTTDPDDDGDGFSDLLEELAGTSGTDGGTTPAANNAPAGTPGPLTIDKMAIKLNFAKSSFDAIQLSGTLSVPAGFVVEGQKVILDAGGVVRTFTLNAKGQSPKALDTFKLSVKAKKGVVAAQLAKYQAKFNKGTYASALQDEGLTSTDATKQPRTVRVQMIFNQSLLEKNQAQIYSAKTGKTGKTTSPK